MDPSHQRGTSPSPHVRTHSQNHIQHSPSPHTSQGPFQAPAQQGIDHTGAFNSAASFGSSLTPDHQNLFPAVGDYTSVSSAQSYHQDPIFTQSGLFDTTGLSNDFTASAAYRQPGGNPLFSDFISPGLDGGGFNGPLFDASTAADFNGTALDPTLLASPGLQSSINPDAIMNSMTTQAQSPTPPHLLSPALNRQASGSPHNSPGLQQSAFAPPGRHSRNASLDPSSAAYPQMVHGGEWNTMRFQSHRRQPSDAHSDVSSSAHPSPYLGNIDDFGIVDNHSPMMNPQQDPSMYNEVMAIGSFSLGDAQNPYITPGHSPAVSPRLVPQQISQQHLPTFTSADGYGMGNSLAPSMNNSFNGSPGLNMFPGAGQEAFPALYSDQMSPPEINIQLAPPSRQASFEPMKSEESPEGALSPPESRSRNRTRAKSDSSVGPRGHSSPGSNRDSKDRLSPAAAGVGSRSPSPSGKSRRSSTSSVPNRDYYLGLADPSRSPSETGAESGPGSGSKRTQKHPATFQCSLCPKRFTRAYNLRSHLRTHTDERPFVCSVCGKAFARQHDRKRHESLHSGEKKFVCRGSLKEGGNWGCGRRFARADALGRHFRSEAGRVCIKPLLEEEALDRQNKDAQAGAQSGLPMGSIPQQAGFDAFGGMGGQSWDPNMGGQPQMYRLPTVLLQQYPSLGGIWDTLPLNGPDIPEDAEEISGRSSFDASGEEFDDGDYMAATGGAGPQSGWASDVGY